MRPGVGSTWHRVHPARSGINGADFVEELTEAYTLYVIIEQDYAYMIHGHAY